MLYLENYPVVHLRADTPAANINARVFQREVNWVSVEATHIRGPVANRQLNQSFPYCLLRVT
jgi:hypothetical protein